jgi:short-subunit dehydrogenase
MSPGTALILGAVSPVARGCALDLAARGWGLVLAGRDQEELRRITQDASLRHQVRAEAVEFDAADIGSHGAFWRQIKGEHPDLKVVVIAFGFMGDQQEMNQTPDLAQEVLITNFNGAVSMAMQAAKDFEAAGEGWICGISSVAGDRGRGSNYIYGAAKGGFSLFLQGLRNRLSKAGVKVLTVKPGFIDTSMTFGKKGVILAASPEATGKDIISSLFGKPDIIYTPRFWSLIMRIIRSIPEGKFKKMNL